MLDFIEKYKFAILGTVLFHVAVFFYTNFTTLARPFHQFEPPIEMTIPLEDIPIDLSNIQLPDPNQNLNAANQQVYNVTSDQNDTRDKSYENFSTQEMDQKVYEDAKALEEQYFNEWESTHGGSTAEKQGGMDIKTEKDKNKTQTSNNPDKSIDTKGENAFAGDVMASFNLKDRKAHSLEKPGYTCNTAGTVVLEIRVGSDGSVKSATYLPGSSVNATECMIEQSIKYAERSRFNYSSSAPAVQVGTITYKFVSK